MTIRNGGVPNINDTVNDGEPNSKNVMNMKYQIYYHCEYAV